MSVELFPTELGFRRPFTQEVSEVLRLKNPHNDPIAFKVKTTAPKQYCVRPNSGRIEPGQSVEVSVLLQAMKEDPPTDAKCRDKFLVQSVLVGADKEFTSVAQVWSTVEQAGKSSINEKKIRVNFLSADGSGDNVATTPSRQTNGHEEPPAYGSPVSNAATPQNYSTAAPVGAVSRLESKPQTNPTYGGGVGSTIASGASAVAAAVPTSADQLKAQLEDAQAQISRLTTQGSEGLRQRTNEAPKTSPAYGTKPAPSYGNKPAPSYGAKAGGSATSTSFASNLPGQPEGVSVQMVAALCLISFLLAYILF